MINTVPYLAALFVPTAGGSFDPSQLSGLEAWWKSDAGVTLVGSDVDQWADQSGNGHTFSFNAFVNALVCARPTLITSGAGTLNGYPGIKFGALGITNLTLPADINLATAGAVYIVYRTSSSGSTEVIMTKDNAGYIATRVAQVDINGSTAFSPFVLGTNTPYTISAQILGASSSKIGLNPEVNGYGSSGAGTPIIRNIGVYDFGLHSQVIVHEVIVYNRTLSSTEDGQVTGYGRTKYAHY